VGNELLVNNAVLLQQRQKQKYIFTKFMFQCLYAQFNSEVNTTFRLRKTHYSRLACFLVINKINLDAALYLFHHVIIFMCPLCEFIFLDCYNTLITSVKFSRDVTTGYNQSVTGCRSQRRQCSCYSTKTHDPHPQIEYDFDEKHIQCILKRVTPPPPLRTAYCLILTMRTAYCLILTLRTAYRLTKENKEKMIVI